MRERIVFLLSANLLAASVAFAEVCRAATIADEIRTEATRKNNDPQGLPLPLAGHWNTGIYQYANGWDPDYQLSLIEQGHYILPSFQLNPPNLGAVKSGYYEKAMRRTAEFNLPVVFICTQLESVLSTEEKFYNLPLGRNPNVDINGKIEKKVSPFGPIDVWKEAGRYWTDTKLLRQFQLWYPNPPLVVFLSNNEHPKLECRELESSRQYRELYGSGRDSGFKRKILGLRWIVRYRALQDGMREGLSNQMWKQNSIFIAYSAFGPSYIGRWENWEDYSLVTEEYVSPWPMAWDGASVPYYVHNWDQSTDYTVWSPQVEAMNWIFMLDEANGLNPQFWWEISVWDGSNLKIQGAKDKRKIYAQRGQIFTPERYKGYIQFGMWLLRPRVVREYRGWTESRDIQKPYFDAVLESCDIVHKNKTLMSFWRKGKLVSNVADKHPYQKNIPARYQDVDRWFLLNTNLTPPKPWTLNTEIPVWALSLVLDEKPNRRWLVYVYSPLQKREGVVVDLPEYGPITVDAPVGGLFYMISEQGKTLKLIET